MPDLKKKRRKPVLLITVASLAAATISYLEFFADPIIDPPEFFSDGHVQIQYLVARSPFSRRVVSRAVTVDRLWRPSRYEFRGRDVLVDRAPATEAVAPDCVLLADDDVHVGPPETRRLLLDQQGYVRFLRERSMGEGLAPFLRQVAEVTGDLHLLRLVGTACVHGKMD
ncbi:MAG TPA: hypothetical protein VFS19_00435 [Planctomycetota bacterium]|nr:hypothetical protein [Planctomycetota bacterium]